MAIYEDMAYVYDKLTDDVNYTQRADYLENIFSEYFPSKPKLIADIGCGTGTMCDILQKRGYDMIGIDLSDSMLNVAKEKNNNVLYLMQDMTSFELYGTVDVIISLLDTVNYLTDDGQLDKFFALCKNYLNPSGLLIFDINSPYKFENVLADNIYNFENEDLFYSWENNFDGKLCEFYLNFFIEDNDGKYNRFTEQHFERCYSVDEILLSIKNAGLSDVGVFGDMCRKPYKKDDERIFFVVKKD